MLSSLIIDDNPFVLNMLTALLKKNNYTVISFQDPEKALEYLKSEDGKKIDIIITDYYMPKISGLELAETIRSTIEIKDTPVILLTRFKSNIYENDPRHEVFNSIIYKPLVADELIKTINRLLPQA